MLDVTVREQDGIAMSTRNAYLSEKEREDASVLHEALLHAEELVARGERDTAVIKQGMRDRIGTRDTAEIDYVEIVDDATLDFVQEVRGPSLAAVAVYFGQARLIDNTVLEPS